MSPLPARCRRLLRLAAPLLALPLLAGCASTVPRLTGTDTLERDVGEIKQRLVEIQRQTTMNAVQLEELRRRVEALEREVGVTPPPPRRPAAELPAEPEDAAIRRTPPSAAEPPPIEEPGAGIEVSDVPAEEAPPARTDVPRPPVEMEPGEAREGDAAAPARVTPAGQALYDRGYTLYHQERYLDAEASFQRFLQAHGGTDLADNALYWIGEARYGRGDVSGALAAFREVVARYPRGNKVPDALLKAGQCLERLGDAESARASYREVSERFPGSAASAVAEERLRELP